MKKIIPVLICSFILLISQAQESKKHYKNQFNLQLSPTFYYTLSGSFTKAHYNITDFAHHQVPQYLPYPNMLLGLHFSAGETISDRHHINFDIGLEGIKKRVLVPISIEYGVRILKKKISPWASIGGGYSLMHAADIGTNYTYFYHGANLTASAGIYVELDNNFSLTVEPTYRLLYLTYNNETAKADGLLHQFGLRARVIFY